MSRGLKSKIEVDQVKSVYVENKLRLKLSDKRCLSCDAPFKSEGRHNRMCNPCRNYVKSWFPVNPNQIG